MSGIQSIREGLSGNVTRVIVVAIIITFIGSVGWAGFFSQGNVNVVATVGSKEITNADLNFEVSTQQFALSQRFPDQEIDDETLFTLSKNNLINKFSVLDFLDSKKIILATDPDREGEAIAWHVKEYLDEKKLLKDKKIERVVFN